MEFIARVENVSGVVYVMNNGGLWIRGVGAHPHAAVRALYVETARRVIALRAAKLIPKPAARRALEELNGRVQGLEDFHNQRNKQSWRPFGRHAALLRALRGAGTPPERVAEWANV